nr:ribonuclease H-like domain-containing protein [Tanacetum cinerariifolium]
MLDEYNALITNETWVLVPRPANVNVGIDCDETFSPVVKLATIRTVLSLVVSRDWPIHQLDVNNAFLHGHLSETVYMHQPSGFVDPNKPNYVCHLRRSVYGIKQAPHAWFQRFASYASRVDFQHSKADFSLFVFHRGSNIAYLLLYVDDIILTASSSTFLQRIIASLHSEFAMTDLGLLNYFLGIFAQRSSSGLFLSQLKSAEEILERAHMRNCNPCRTPVDTKSKLGSDGDPVSDPTLYRSFAGALQYLTFMRPDLSYVFQHGIDCDETFSPVVKLATIRTVLSLVFSRDWPIHQLDVNNAFLHGHLSETVYMHQPPGFVDPNKPNYVCHLRRSVYGLKQAPHAWFQRFASYASRVGFQHSKADFSLFVFHRGSNIAYLLLYVDNIILTASSSTFLQRIIASLHSEFAMTDLGSLNYFLGIFAQRSSSGLFLSQLKSAEEILERAHMQNCNPCRTPVDTESKLGSDGDPVSNPTLYRSFAGALQYLTFMRPDLSYVFQHVCLYMHDPCDPHFTTLKRILRYVCGTLLSWFAKRQVTLSRSSAEAKYRRVANVVAKTAWILKLHTPLLTATLVYCDNVSAVCLLTNLVQHQLTKHIEIDIHFVRDYVASGQVRVLHVPSRFQYADIFKK